MEEKDNIDNENEIIPKNEIERILSFKYVNVPNLYGILKLSYNDTEEEIKRKYLSLAKIIHPDKCKLNDAEEAFKIVSDAYKKLGDFDTQFYYRKLIKRSQEIIKGNRAKINKQRILKGLNKLPEDTLNDEINSKMNEIHDEINNNTNTIVLRRKREREKDLEEKVKKITKHVEKEREADEKILEERRLKKRIKKWQRFVEKRNKGKIASLVELKPIDYKTEKIEDNGKVVLYKEKSII